MQAQQLSGMSSSSSSSTIVRKRALQWETLLAINGRQDSREWGQSVSGWHGSWDSRTDDYCVSAMADKPGEILATREFWEKQEVSPNQWKGNSDYNDLKDSAWNMDKPVEKGREFWEHGQAKWKGKTDYNPYYWNMDKSGESQKSWESELQEESTHQNDWKGTYFSSPASMQDINLTEEPPTQAAAVADPPRFAPPARLTSMTRSTREWSCQKCDTRNAATHLWCFRCLVGKFSGRRSDIQPAVDKGPTSVGDMASASTTAPPEVSGAEPQEELQVEEPDWGDIASDVPEYDLPLSPAITPSEEPPRAEAKEERPEAKYSEESPLGQDVGPPGAEWPNLEGVWQEPPLAEPPSVPVPEAPLEIGLNTRKNGLRCRLVVDRQGHCCERHGSFFELK